jgi:hypothetical protein
MKYWLDTEFNENGVVIDLLSIGIVAEDGREYYAESSEADLAYANAFTIQNVYPYLNPDLQKPKKEIANEIKSFLLYDKNPEIWGWYGAYDWIVLCQLYGRMVDLPKGFPMYIKDLKSYVDDFGNPTLPKPNVLSIKHHALEDAKWLKKAWYFMDDYIKNKE